MLSETLSLRENWDAINVFLGPHVCLFFRAFGTWVTRVSCTKAVEPIELSFRSRLVWAQENLDGIQIPPGGEGFRLASHPGDCKGGCS